MTEARIRFVIQRAAGRGYALTQIRNPVLRIGRGTNAELRSENPAVALEHATIEGDAAGYTITDRGSITGTYVNRKPVETARLAKGDVLEIGDLRIEVQMAEADKPLFLRVIPTAATTATAAPGDEDDEAIAAKPGARVVRAKKIDYAAAYRLQRPWLTKVSLTAILLIIALGLIGEMIRPEQQKLFMPGGLSSAHMRVRDRSNRPIAEQCSACHTPWNSVSNAKCVECHPHQPHAMTEAMSPDCFSCHAEHRGEEKLAAVADGTCIGCHADLTKHVQRASVPKFARIPSFGDQHPELVVPPDANTLRFNHRYHLNPKGILNAQGRREVLACEGCHGAKNAEPVAVDFEQHCQRCHLLTFDARFPKEEVPHGGDPGHVYGFVLATYARDPNIIGKPIAEVRRILAARRAVVPDERAIQNANQVFKTKCRQCHEIQQRGARLAVTPPVMRRDWLTSSRFSHARHRTTRCENCHEGARDSVSTSDVSMPRRANCTTCHAQDARVTQAASTCVTCHEYHLRPQRSVVVASLAPAGAGGVGRGGRMFQGILLAAIVILLVVVLVPLGLALYQRLRPAAPDRPASAPRPAPPPIPPPPVDLPTTKIPAIQASAPPAKPAAPAAAPAPAPVPAPPPVDRTALVDVPEKAAGEPTSGGTEMVQWYGMLTCTSGPLEGQRFVVEDEGFYIGRDATLSKIVIPDSRVSKRHVRIVPRNGRVWAIDQSSTNGTFLGAPNGERITEVQLKRGDVVVLADNVASFLYQV